MLITNNLDGNVTMKEFAARFKQHRVAVRITQRELAKKTGVGLRTISRFEKGEEIGILTFIKLLQGVELERNLENVIPDYTRRPSYYANNGNLPKRAVRKKQADSEWKWGDEQ